MVFSCTRKCKYLRLLPPSGEFRYYRSRQEIDPGMCCDIYLMELSVDDGWLKGRNGTDVDYKVLERTVEACATVWPDQIFVSVLLLSGNVSLGQ